MVYCRAASWVIKHRGAVSCGRIKSFNAILSARREKKKHKKKQFGFSDGGSKSGSAEVSSVCNSLRLPGPASASQCPLRLPNPPITGGINTHGGQQGGGAAAGSPASRLRTDVPESVSQGIFFCFFSPLPYMLLQTSSTFHHRPHNVLYCSNGLFDRHAPGRFATSASSLAIS